MRPTTREWVEKAEGDLRVARSQRRSSQPVWEAVAFHSQQCIEKYLKAWLTEQVAYFPKTHDLEQLANLCMPTLASVAKLMSDLRFLTSYAVEVRYPGVSVNAAQAMRCLEISVSSRQLVRNALGIKKR